MRKIIISLLVAGFLVGPAPASAFWLFNQPSSTGEVVESDLLYEENVTVTPPSEELVRKCLKSNEKLSKAIESEEKRIKRHAKAIEKKKNKWNEKVARLERKKCTNVARLRGDMRNLNVKYDNWHNSWEKNFKAYTQQLRETLKLSCIDDKKAYNQQYKKAKSIHKKFIEQDKKDSAEIEKFLKDPVYVHAKLVECP